MKNRLNKLHHGLYEKLARQIKTYDTSNIALIHDHLVCILKRKNTAPFKGFAIDSLRKYVVSKNIRPSAAVSI